MERLTEKRDGQNVIPLRQDGKNIWALTVAGMGDNPTQFLYGAYADKLAQYENLEEQGLLLRLPCKKNSKVFLICSRYTKCSKYDEEFEEFSCSGCEDECDSHKEYYIHTNNSVSIEWIVCNIKKFGETVFLTREEAEQKLKEMESD